MPAFAMVLLHLILSTETVGAWTLSLSPRGHHHRLLCPARHISAATSAIAHRRRQSPATPSSAALASSAGSTEEAFASLLEGIDESSTFSFPLLRVGRRVGSGSYGTVHQGYILRSKTDVVPCIAKRAWTRAEIARGVPAAIADAERDAGAVVATGLVAQRTGAISSSASNDEVESAPLTPPNIRTRAERCKHYWNVERHCFQKMTIREANSGGEGGGTSMTAYPAFLGVYRDEGPDQQLGGSATMVEGYGSLDEEAGEGLMDNGWFGASKDRPRRGHEWMVFEFVGETDGVASSSAVTTGVVGTPAPTLLDAMELDWKDQHGGTSSNHHLNDIQKALNLPEEYSFGESLDAIFLSLLENLKDIHAYNIVHRDLKPGNLLCDKANQRLRLIDFGSAADLDPSLVQDGGGGFGSLFSGGTQRVGYDEGIAAISPVYSAPETFVKLNANPLAFDVFSAGLIMSQLLFNLLDERTDAGFLQQLKEVSFDLDAWMERELGIKLRVAGFDTGLEYLGERRGLWALLKRMFEKDPMKRITSAEALERFHQIIGLRNGEIEWSDAIILEVAQEESYFETVIESLESCTVNLLEPENIPRPLHFLASFRKGTPVGLTLAEASEVENDGSMSSGDWKRWEQATQYAIPGEVFVKGLEDGGQADQLGIFEIGDRLRGVGELPFVNGGFEQAINLINRQPSKSEFLKLHFDRMRKNYSKPDQTKEGSKIVEVTDQGAWKSGGRRGNQEDSFVLHEIKNNVIGDVLLAGVFDGHAGTAASETVSSILPALFTSELLAASPENSPIPNAITNSWETTCNTYRNGCDENGECVADYDPTEGILFAETGSKDLVAGTTATVASLALGETDELTVLNCGDSRTLLVGSPDSENSVVIFETRDHSPDDELEIERLEKGKAAGLDYSVPMCSMTSGSYMVVGDYQYALCRSLEGSFVTSKGIVSEPDVTILNIGNLLADRQNCALVLACDGLFEVMSNEEVGREVIRMRGEGYKAGDIAKNLCGQALKKGSYDNLSVIVVYLN